MALRRAVAARKRTRMSMAVVGSVAAAVLCLGGFGGVVYGAGPGDALYGLRTMIFGEQQATRDDAVVLAAQTELAEVQQLIDQGQWEQAQDKLEDASPRPSRRSMTMSASRNWSSSGKSLTVKVRDAGPERDGAAARSHRR